MEEKERIKHYNENVNHTTPIDGNVLINLFREFTFKPGDVCIDLGCGNGKVTNLIKEMFGVDIIGVDYSAFRVAHAKTRYKDISFIQADIIEFLARSVQSHCDMYDFMFLFEVLEHTENPKAVLDAAVKWLSGTGSIIGSIPINMPYKTHVQVWKTAEDFLAIDSRLKELFKTKNVLIWSMQY